MTIVLPTCTAILDQLGIKGDAIFGSMKVAYLKMMIRYEFNWEEYKKKGILKPELKTIAMSLSREYLEKE